MEILNNQRLKVGFSSLISLVQNTFDSIKNVFQWLNAAVFLI